jgi:FlaA1/EpsC-like NDP-sugar epimerase
LARGGAVVRFGNLIGSSGSVFRTWADAVKSGKRLTITDREMTRYFIPVRRAAEFCADKYVPGKVAIPAHMNAARMGTLLTYLTLNEERDVDVIGMRPGETLHQWLIAPGDRAHLIDGVHVLDPDRGYTSDGESSDMAHRWDARELLKEAGVVS